MRRRELPIATVAAVLAEVVRGRAADARVFAALRRERVIVHPVDTRSGFGLGTCSAGGRVRSSPWTPSLIAVADLAGGAVVATVDLRDLRRLAAPTASVSIVGLATP